MTNDFPIDDRAHMSPLLYGMAGVLGGQLVVVFVVDTKTAGSRRITLDPVPLDPVSVSPETDAESKQTVKSPAVPDETLIFRSRPVPVVTGTNAVVDDSPISWDVTGPA